MHACAVPANVREGIELPRVSVLGDCVPPNMEAVK